MLVAEIEEKKHEKERAVSESFPPLKLSGLSVQELQVLAQTLQTSSLSFYFFFFFDGCFYLFAGAL